MAQTLFFDSEEDKHLAARAISEARIRRNFGNVKRDGPWSQWEICVNTEGVSNVLSKKLMLWMSANFPVHVDIHGQEMRVCSSDSGGTLKMFGHSMVKAPPSLGRLLENLQRSLERIPVHAMEVGGQKTETAMGSGTRST